MTNKQKAILTIDGQAPIELPVMNPTMGNQCIDVRKLGGDSGLFTYDAGFLSTASCQSKITFIDGNVAIPSSNCQINAAFSKSPIC